MYGFSPFTISVGTSYFERLAARDPALMAAARATPEFTAFVAATPVEHNPLRRPIGAAHMHLGPKHWCALPRCSHSAPPAGASCACMRTVLSACMHGRAA